MASGSDRRGDIAPLCSRVVSATWGWRTELAVVGLLGLVDHLAWRLGGTGAELVAVGTIGIVFWRFPALARWLRLRLVEGSYLRWWVKVARHARLTSPFGLYPVLKSVRPVPAGEVLRVDLPVGMDSTHLERACQTIAAAMAVGEVRVAAFPANAACVEVTVVRSDPLASPLGIWPSLHAAHTSLWEPVVVGVDEFGEMVWVSLPEHNLLIGGEPGAGKSNLLSLLVAAAALDPTVALTLMDGKQVELAPWSASADYFVGPDLSHARFVLSQLRGELEERYGHLLSQRKRKVGPDDRMGLHVVVVDELAFFVKGKNTTERADIAEALRDLVSRGRAAGFIVVCATQKPSHDVVPTYLRDLFSYRCALRCTSPEASDTILGAGWATQGYSAATIDPGARGVGFLLAEGGVPRRMRAFAMGDEELESLAGRAEALRRTTRFGGMKS